MKLSLSAINFINSVQELIDKDDFMEIYARLNFSDLDITPELTAAFLSCNINPLEHLDFIPTDFFKGWYMDTTSFRVPHWINRIGSYAFANTSNMRECFIPEGCESIYMAAFKDSESLTDIYIPYSVTTFGSQCIDSDTKIHCVENSAAHEYAIHNGNEFDFNYRY